MHGTRPLHVSGHGSQRTQTSIVTTRGALSGFYAAIASCRAISNEESGSGPSPEPTDAAAKLMRSLSEVRHNSKWFAAHPGRPPAMHIIVHMLPHSV